MQASALDAEVNVQELLNCDANLHLAKGPATFKVKALGLPHAPKSEALHFIKAPKIWAELEKHITQDVFSNLVVVVGESLLPQAQAHKAVSVCLVSSHVELTLAKVSKIFYQKKFKNISWVLDGRTSGSAQIHPTALVSPLAFIGEHVEIAAGVEVMPGCYVGAHCKVGERTKIFPNTNLYPFVQIGADCRIHSSTVVGADGFGYVFDQGVHHKIWHLGGVIIHDNVEIGANTCVDAGTFSPTIIESGCIIDNQVQIGHNSRLGKAVVICGQSGLGGSSRVGDYSVFGGRVALGPQCEVGKYAKIAGAAIVNHSWGDGVELGGHPARPLKEWLKGLAVLKKLTQARSKQD